MLLSQRTLSGLPAELPRPTYDRSAVSVGIVHIGVGGFHRSHEAMYVDALMEQGTAMDWGICGLGLLPGDRRMADVMEAQDCLYTLVVKHADGRLEPRVIGSIVEYVFAPDDPDAAVERMADPAVRIVSLTVTEGGYNIDPLTGEFDADNEDIRHDARMGSAPRTAFGLITAALARRRERGIAPFTVMSCDNIQGNGDVTRRSLLAFAGLADADLATWISEHVPFPNGMVDRITPVTTDADRAEVTRRWGLEDGWPVVCEPFTQWVLEDHFVSRPPLDEVGVQLVQDVTPYELMKLRLLNASHQALCYLGYLSGYRLVHDVCQDELFAGFLLAYMDDEATPSLEPVPGIDLDVYKPQLVDRFSNAQVRDTVARLCAESSDRIPKWLVPVIRHNLETGGRVALSAAVVAGWARYAEGFDEDGAPIEVVDQRRDAVMAAAHEQRRDPLAFLRNRSLFGDLVDDDRFAAAYLAALDSLHTKGARATVEHLMSVRTA